MCVFTGYNGSGVMTAFAVGDADLGDSNGVRHSEPYVGGKNFGSAWVDRVTSLHDY